MLLTIAGAACELLGVGLIVREIADHRRLARDVLDESVQGPRELEEVVKSIPSGPISRFLKIDWDEMVQINNRQLRDALAEATTRLIEADIQRDRALRAFLHRQLGGSLAERLTGVAFFVAGIFLTAGAQLIQVNNP